MNILLDSPVEARRKEMPKGDGDWPGYDRCYDRLKAAAEHLAGNQYTRLGQDHIDIMAAMGPYWQAYELAEKLVDFEDYFRR